MADEKRKLEVTEVEATGLSQEELEAEAGELLPERQEQQLVDINIAVPINIAVATNILSPNSIAYADATQTNTITQGITDGSTTTTDPSITDASSTTTDPSITDGSTTTSDPSTTDASSTTTADPSSTDASQGTTTITTDPSTIGHPGPSQ
jgi:hypothetical protein